MLKAFQQLWQWYGGTFSSKVVNVFRWSIALVTALSALTWLPYLKLYFTSAGFIDRETVRVISSGYSIFYFYDTPWFVYLMYALLLVALFFILWNKFTRVAFVVVFVLFESFLNRMALVQYGGTAIVEIALFFALFIDFNAAKKGKEVPAWPLRLLQIQICLVYLSAALEKVKIPTWTNGTQLQGIAVGSLSYLPLAHFLSNPILSVMLTYLTMAGELSFTFLVWNPATRRPILLLVAFVHLCIACVMNVTYFSFIMLAVLTIFLRDEDLEEFMRWCQVARKKLKPFLLKS